MVHAQILQEADQAAGSAHWMAVEAPAVIGKVMRIDSVININETQGIIGRTLSAKLTRPLDQRKQVHHQSHQDQEEHHPLQLTSTFKRILFRQDGVPEMSRSASPRMGMGRCVEVVVVYRRRHRRRRHAQAQVPLRLSPPGRKQAWARKRRMMRWGAAAAASVEEAAIRSGGLGH